MEAGGSLGSESALLRVAFLSAQMPIPEEACSFWEDRDAMGLLPCLLFFLAVVSQAGLVFVCLGIWGICMARFSNHV